MKNKDKKPTKHFLKDGTFFSKLLWIILAPLTLIKINDNLFLIWFIGSMLAFAAINIDYKVSRLAMILMAYIASVLIVLIALFYYQIKK